ncbi:MAG: Rpn family recombination-promoting nuclease/putative transposase [Tannerella sp.]|jgi:predicted transposase/invertase (TIGR01784 family)|nr:Rpn family recombination-promoting nuclease/putative transposase [Tannerella sp.]
MEKSNYIRFDWAIKRLLRQKANFVVLEGFLSSLLNETVRIERILESEGNKNTEDDKFNRLDMLAENSHGELIIIEVQNNREPDYFHRMLYGASKAITEYMKESESFVKVKKLYSINIVYFDLGQGAEYVYHGRTKFRGIHSNDILKLSASQEKQFRVTDAGELHPEYYVLRVDDFDKVAVNPLDEWISFLKTGHIPEDARAPGLAEARERLKLDRMDREERIVYNAHMEALQYQRSVIQTSLIKGIAKGKAEGIAKEKTETVRKSNKAGLTVETIADITGLTIEEINAILNGKAE